MTVRGCEERKSKGKREKVRELIVRERERDCFPFFFFFGKQLIENKSYFY